MEEKIKELIGNTVSKLGFDIVKVTFQGGKHKVLEVLIDRANGEKVQVGDCRLVSHNISALLDVEDIISGKYFLEVASAGVERPLVNFKDYERFKGRDIKVRLKEPVKDKLTYKGKIVEVHEEKIVLKSKNIELIFDYNNIKNANLILTDEMFRELLKGKTS